MILSFDFEDHQLVSLFDYALQLCKTKTSSVFNIEKHSAMVLWILKVQQLPLFILSSLKKEIILAIRNSISHDLGGYVAKLDAFKVSVSYCSDNYLFLSEHFSGRSFHPEEMSFL